MGGVETVSNQVERSCAVQLVEIIRQDRGSQREPNGSIAYSRVGRDRYHFAKVWHVPPTRRFNFNIEAVVIVDRQKWKLAAPTGGAGTLNSALDLEAQRGQYMA